MSTDFPSELVSHCSPLIGFYGLDTSNEIHKTVFESFASKKSERPSIQFELIPSNYEFPTAKPKRQSYEWYNPKNILKRNWMLKHLHVLPSLIVLFQEIEWNDSQFSEKQLQCAAHIQHLKNSLTDRHTRLAIVLLQKTAPSLMNDDLLASERAANLTSLCDINAKQLFVLPYNDHLLGYTMRLEQSFLELSQSYYIQMIKQVRQHRDMLTGSHFTLKVRHQFKLGFISEMRFDYSTALKHYSQAYINIDEIRVVDTNCLEIKTVAGFINYKMCKLMFKLNVPRDSITQFKNHIEKYKSRTGFKDLLFEHYAWLSVQYSYFAELFCEAIKLGLPALQTQHPGIYYHKAAEYICMRREAFSQVLSMSPSTETSPQATQFSELYTDYFGVRNGARNTTEPVTEQQIISLVQEMEKKFTYSTAIISLLGQAMAQFKIYKCSRFRKKLAIDMAEEYFKSGEYTKALTLYSLMLSDYRHDKWYKIFTEILIKTLQSAYLAASVTDFISCSIETLSPNIILNKTERLNILENLWKVLENVPPISQSQIAPELNTNWESSLANFKSSVNIDLDQISDLIDCKVSFQKDQIKFNETVALNLYIRSNSEVPVKLKSISVILTTNKKAKVYRLTANNCSEYKISSQTKQEELIGTRSAVDFLLDPGKCYKLDFEASQYQFMENVEIEINRVEIKMGGDKNFALLIMQKTLNKTKQFQKFDIHSDYIENIKVIPTCYVIPTFHLTTQTIQDNQPMLVNEYYKMSTNITNNYDICLQNVGISINLPTTLKNKVFLTTDVTAKTQKLNSLIQFDIGDIQMQSTTTINYYVISLVEGNIELKQNLWYQTDDLSGAVVEKTSNDKVFLKAGSNDSPTSPSDSNSKSENENYDTDNRHNISIEYLQDNLMKKVREDIIIVPCVEEIKFVSRFYTLNKSSLDKCFKNEDFLMRVNIEVKSPFPLDILDVSFLSDFNISEKYFENKKKILKNNLQMSSKLELVHMLNAKNTSDTWITKNTFNSKIPTDYQELFIKDKNQNLFSFTDKTAFEKTEQVIEDPFISKDEKDKMQKLSMNYTNTQNLIKNIFHEANDAIEMIGDKEIFGKSGFFNCNFNPVNKQPQDCNIYGVYCVKWRKSGSDAVNESKFIINGLEIIEPALNLYCYIEKRLYVREIFTLKITIKNPTKNVLNLQATFNSADGFMFSGHRQLNITIFSYSSFDLCYNLYPLKVGWQLLPTLQLEYDMSYEEISNEALLTAETMTVKQQQQDIARRQKQVDLSNLVNRWMPKMVFVHPPTRKNDAK